MKVILEIIQGKDTGKRFDGMAISSGHPLVSSVSQRKHKVKFKYALGRTGNVTCRGEGISPLL